MHLIKFKYIISLILLIAQLSAFSKTSEEKYFLLFYRGINNLDAFNFSEKTKIQSRVVNWGGLWLVGLGPFDSLEETNLVNQKLGELEYINGISQIVKFPTYYLKMGTSILNADLQIKDGKMIKNAIEELETLSNVEDSSVYLDRSSIRLLIDSDRSSLSIFYMDIKKKNERTSYSTQEIIIDCEKSEYGEPVKPINNKLEISYKPIPDSCIPTNYNITLAMCLDLNSKNPIRNAYNKVCKNKNTFFPIATINDVQTRLLNEQIEANKLKAEAIEAARKANDVFITRYECSVISKLSVTYNTNDKYIYPESKKTVYFEIHNRDNYIYISKWNDFTLGVRISNGTDQFGVRKLANIDQTIHATCTNCYGLGMYLIKFNKETKSISGVHSNARSVSNINGTCKELKKNL